MIYHILRNLAEAQSEVLLRVLGERGVVRDEFHDWICELHSYIIECRDWDCFSLQLAYFFLAKQRP